MDQMCDSTSSEEAFNYCSIAGGSMEIMHFDNNLFESILNKFSLTLFYWEQNMEYAAFLLIVPSCFKMNPMCEGILSQFNYCSIGGGSMELHARQ